MKPSDRSQDGTSPISFSVRATPRLRLALLAAAVFSAGGVAHAGGCPEGKQGPTPFEAVTESSGDIKVHEYQRLDLGAERMAAEGRVLRARTISFGPGAVVQLHSHDNRPETAMMKHGTVTVFETNCQVSYPMREGVVYQSGIGDDHWVSNDTEETAVMLVVDILDTTE